MQISNYQVVEMAYTGSRTLVYRAIHIYNKLPVVIKLLRNEYPTFSELGQFRNQYAISKNLHSPLIIQTYSLETYRNSYALVMEDFGGVSLQEWVQKRGGKLSLKEFLEIAITTSNALDILYQEQIIHKDIKPANILINPQTKQIKLIDFSIASLLPRETQEIQNANSLEGTLAYISPEQTGRMNRGIDYRSDFYSLGITFYELLTGALPFQANDPMELIHSHIAKLAPLVHEINPEIPLVLSAIVMKLMAKNAEDRYQSALGLKFDLEQCLTQLQETGKIESFEIGQQDVSDRFLIPDKLYGRETEVETLLQAFERVSLGATEMMLVAGFSGIGKTAVVNEVHKPIVRQRGYFIKGKYDQFNRNVPLSAFVQAFRDLMGQLLSKSDEQLAQWQAKILAALGENGQVLIDVIPELEQVIGKQPLAPELSGSAAQNRFNLLFQKFIEVFTTAEHPLVMFLDDLQWADSASLQLIKLLMSDSGYLLMLGAYRDNEVSPVHPFILAVEELRKAGSIVNTITLVPLAFADTNQLISDTLKCSLELAQPLTELVDRKTQGNPFFTTQFLKALYKDGQIRFNLERRYWECDMAQVNALSLTDDVVEFMALQLQKLPQETQQVMKLAACIGNQFDLETLAIISECSPTDAATALWKVLQDGLILPTSQVYKFFQDADQSEAEHCLANPVYRFLHDRVQQAAYSLIPDPQKQATHLKIGQLLLTNTLEEELESRVFDIVNQLNMGAELVNEALPKEKLVQLNLMAGRKAKLATAYAAAVSYLNTGLTLLDADSWQYQYNLTLELHELLAESEYLNTNFETSRNLIQQTLLYAQNPLEKIKVYEIQIQSYTAQNKLLEAIDIGREALSLLGIDFPQSCNFDTTISEHQQLKILLGDRSIESLANLPNLSDPTQFAALRILVGLFASVYLAKPELLPFKIFTMVKICIQYGNSAPAAIAYSLYGLFLCATGEIERGYQFGQLATIILEDFQAKELTSKVYLTFALFIKHWQDSIRSTLPVFLAGLSSGLEHGDLEYVGYCANCYCQFLFWTGENLEFAEAEADKYCQLMQDIKQDVSLVWGNIWRQTVINLSSKTGNPTMLIGSCFDEVESLPYLIQIQNINGICYVYLAKLLLLYLFADYQNAKAYASKFEQYEQGAAGLLIIPFKNFYQSLTLLELYPSTNQEQKIEDLKKISKNQESMEIWAHHAPSNYLHKFQLVQAETYRILGQNYEAGDWYDRAIASAKVNGFIQEEALAKELAAKFYLHWGKEKIAASYMQEAYYSYAHWGAKAKVANLESLYPQLLAPILQQQKMALSTTETVFATTTITTAQTTSTQSSSSSSTSISTALDLATVLKASQTLSSEIQLDKLLATLLHTVLKNAGADKVALLMPRDHQWFVEAIATVDQPAQIQSIALSSSLEVPQSLINTVKRSRQPVMFVDATIHPTVMTDIYIVQQQPKSLLCNPILNQGKLIAILYLENHVTVGAFTSDRVELLNLICTQAAISLENARLYEQEQQKKQALEKALSDLQNTQLQLVQSEKMSALGNLVAGVAHEMNNPLGFISASLQQAKPTLDDILKHLQLYQEKFPHKSEEIIDHEVEIDLEYTLKDLPKTIDSIAMACDRLKNISTSLRTFSRADQDYKVPFYLYKGIESTILILKHRLKANDQHPEIEVITEYGNIPQIECFPGQLNQVFMNILANAIDALEESNIGRSFAEITANPNKITITTTVIDRHVQISIIDNGMGMSEEVKNKAFDHLFTTKEVGKGTGLGLAIVRQIIEEKHGGHIQVNSTLGQGTEFIITLPIKADYKV